MDNLVSSIRCADVYVDDTDTYTDYDGTQTVTEHDDLADESADDDGPLGDHAKVIRTTAGRRAHRHVFFSRITIPSASVRLYYE